MYSGPREDEGPLSLKDLLQGQDCWERIDQSTGLPFMQIKWRASLDENSSLVDHIIKESASKWETLARKLTKGPKTQERAFKESHISEFAEESSNRRRCRKMLLAWLRMSSEHNVGSLYKSLHAAELGKLADEELAVRIGVAEQCGSREGHCPARVGLDSSCSTQAEEESRGPPPEESRGPPPEERKAEPESVAMPPPHHHANPSIPEVGDSFQQSSYSSCSESMDSVSTYPSSLSSAEYMSSDRHSVSITTMTSQPSDAGLRQPKHEPLLSQRPMDGGRSILGDASWRYHQASAMPIAKVAPHDRLPSNNRSFSAPSTGETGNQQGEGGSPAGASVLRSASDDR